MAISVVDLGQTSNTSQASLTLTLTTGIPSGALVTAMVTSKSSTSTNSVGDSGSNTYTQAAQAYNNNNVNQGQTSVFYSYNATAISSGGTITVTKASSKDCTLSAFYATGVMSTADPIDSSVTNSTFALSSAPTITSGSAGSTGELFVCALGRNSTVSATIIDSGHNWVAPFTTSQVAASLGACGGNQVNTSSGTLTWASTAASVTSVSLCILAFKPTPSSAATPILRGPIPGGLIFLP